jgi:hypothetical protein
MDEAATSAETRRRDMEAAFDEERERVHPYTLHPTPNVISLLFTITD